MPSPVSLRTGSALALLVLTAGCDGVGINGADRIYAGGELFGAAAALDGGQAVVGAYGSDEAFVIRRSGGGWEKEALLGPPSGLDADVTFGWAVAIDGSVAVVGAPVLGVAASTIPGRAFVFEREAGGWTRVAELRAVDPTLGRLYGLAVAVSNGRVAVASNAAKTPLTGDLVEPAAVVIYERTGAGWTESSRVEETEFERSNGLGLGSLFGSAVALDGDRLAVGSVGQDAGGVRDAGAVRVYERAGTAWALTATLTPPSPQGRERIGQAVTLDGPLLVASGPGPGTGSGAGSVLAFRRTGAGWAFESELVPDVVTGDDLYGRQMSASGDRVVVGAQARARGRGSVFVWVRRPSGAWELEAELVPEGLVAGAGFGESVALDGDVLLAGAIGVAGGRGGVYAFRRGPGGWVQE